MAAYNQYGNPRRKKNKRSTFYAPAMFVVILVALVFFIGVFFRVQDIQVVGSVSYTSDEIIEASGIEIGDNLFFINRFSASSSIFTKLPFVDEASISRQMPSTIIINVSESVAVAYVDWQGQHWMMDAKCKLLGTADDETIASLIFVKGIEPLSPTQGETMSVSPDETLKLNYLTDLLSVLADDGLLPDVSILDMSNATDPKMEYLERFTVNFGSDDQLDYKLRMLLATVQQLEADEMGSIDVSDGDTVYVSID